MIALLRRGAISIGALTLGLGLAAPAMADTYNHRDAHRDVGDMRRTSDTPHRRAPLNRETDVTVLHVRHDEARIWVRVRLRSTSLKGLKWRQLQVSLKTPGDRYEVGWLQTSTGFQCSHFDATTFTGFHGCGPGRVHREGRSIALSINRSWVGSPRWIRVAASVITLHANHFFIDRAMSPNWRQSSPDTYSRRIRSS